MTLSGPKPVAVVGGVTIYAPEDKKGLFGKLKARKEVKVLPKEGNLNVVMYRGMTIKFPDQNKDIKIFDNRTSKPRIYDYNGKTELFLNNAEINGSERDDKVVSYCTNSIFNFKNGGNDVITHITAFDEEDDENLFTEQANRNTFNIGEEDILNKEVRFYDGDDFYQELDLEFRQEDDEFIIHDINIEEY